MRAMIRWFLLIVVCIASSVAQAGEIHVLSAASLTGLLQIAGAEFEKSSPGQKVLLEPGGSLMLVRKVVDLKQPADLLILADRSLIGTALPTRMISQSFDYVSDRMAILIGRNAKHGEQITSGNWQKILAKPDVRIAISDPDVAPVGYRALLVWKLASRTHASLYEQLRNKIRPGDMRPNASALLALLEAGEVDYAFDYYSVGKQAGLKMVELPASVNLGDPAFTKDYQSVTVDISGSAPGQTRTVRGEPIVYSIVLPGNARNAVGAEAFARFLLGPRGRVLAAEKGLRLAESSQP